MRVLRRPLALVLANAKMGVSGDPSIVDQKVIRFTVTILEKKTFSSASIKAKSDKKYARNLSRDHELVNCILDTKLDKG